MSLMGDNGLFEPSLDKVIDFDGMFGFLIVFTLLFFLCDVIVQNKFRASLEAL